ncbi:MAG: phosphoadenylyl-sulfate reductase [Proteobacteria bacterium]|nr:phosphoadenylyl-sulfate reductase [Pseudomonadota bacterium]
MGKLITLHLEERTAQVRALLAAAQAEHGRLVYSNSLGAEAMVLTDIIASDFPAIDMFSIDTGRLHEETYTVLEKLQHRYGNRIRLIAPEAAALERLIARQGVNGFYASVEARQECCRVRKIEPFRRAIAGYAGWITGVRREQSAARAGGELRAWDAEYGLHKISPLLEWSEAEVWQYIRARALPYNALHDRQYPSIGCSPCTRAIQPGESRRAGRWWWEQSESRECGLHPRPGRQAAVA